MTMKKILLSQQQPRVDKRCSASSPSNLSLITGQPETEAESRAWGDVFPMKNSPDLPSSGRRLPSVSPGPGVSCGQPQNSADVIHVPAPRLE